MPTLALKYKIRFDLTTSPPSIIFTDLIAEEYNTVYGYTLANIKGMIRVTSPLGVIYANTGFVAADYSAPDTKGAATAVWLKSGMAIPLDTDEDAVLGEYKIEYMVSVDGTTTFISDEFTYSLQFVTPSVVLTPTANVRTSRLVVVDATDYVVEGVSPTNDLTVDRTQTVIFPSTSGESNQTSTAASFAVSGNMWSGTFNMNVLASGLVYKMASWSGGDPSVEVKTNVQGETAIEVEADDCACTYYACMVAIEEKYRAAKYNGNLREAERLMDIRNDIGFYHELYVLSVTCGESWEYWCNLIKEVAQSENCMCPEDSGSTLSEEIIPVTTPPAAGGSVVPGTIIHSGNTVPSGEIGRDEDYYIRTASGYEIIYKKLSGTWTQLFIMKGSAGAAGADAISILSNFIGASQSNGTAEMTLATYTVDNTPTLKLATNGDMLFIASSFELAANDNGKTMKLYLGSTIIGTYYTDSDVDSDSDVVTFSAWLTRISAAAVAVKCSIARGSAPAVVAVNTFSESVSQDLTADFDIKVTGQNAVSALGEITCRELRVERIPSV